LITTAAWRDRGPPGNQSLQLNDHEYSNSAGEQFTVSMLQYFISNIRLRCIDGKEFVVRAIKDDIERGCIFPYIINLPKLSREE